MMYTCLSLLSASMQEIHTTNVYLSIRMYAVRVVANESRIHMKHTHTYTKYHVIVTGTTHMRLYSRRKMLVFVQFNRLVLPASCVHFFTGKIRNIFKKLDFL